LLIVNHSCFASMSDEEKELIALRNGSEKAFETIYKRYAGKLYNFIMTLSHGNRYAAEEIVQSVFVKLWEVREQIQPEKSVLSYLSVIAKNMLLNRYQRQTIEFVYQEYIMQEQLPFDTVTEKELDRKWLQDFIDELIDQLPPSRKRIFILSRKEDLSTKQIAEIMHISVSTVETQLSLATRFMRRQLERNYDKLFLLCLTLLI